MMDRQEKESRSVLQGEGDLDQMQATPLKITPFFDLETFMLLSGMKRIDGETAQVLQREWHRIYDLLRGYRLGEPDSGYLVIYLDRPFDRELEKARAEDRDRAERLEMIAQSMILASLFEVLPESAEKGCAPVPQPNGLLDRSLSRLGLAFQPGGYLDVSFGLVTELPYRGDCDSCYARDGCTKRIFSEEERAQ